MNLVVHNKNKFLFDDISEDCFICLHRERFSKELENFSFLPLKFEKLMEKKIFPNFVKNLAQYRLNKIYFRYIGKRKLVFVVIYTKLTQSSYQHPVDQKQSSIYTGMKNLVASYFKHKIFRY